jgi:hypothetical protein
MRSARWIIVAACALCVLPAAAADLPPGTVADVRAQFRAAVPDPESFTVYCLDWAATLDEARQQAAAQGRPILLAVVTNSFGNLYTGHC